MRVLNAADARPNNIHDFVSEVMTSEIAQILPLYGDGFFSSEVEKLKWFCFDLALNFALYT